jgi:hypothetical protein
VPHYREFRLETGGNKHCSRHLSFNPKLTFA